MLSKLDYGLLYCDERNLFYAELMFDNEQWGEIILDKYTGDPKITVWECDFTVFSNDLLCFISNASSQLKNYEATKKR